MDFDEYYLPPRIFQGQDEVTQVNYYKILKHYTCKGLKD